ncbi:MAG: hypothetical protein HUJ76_04205 [Parasporobacterium sp.]|nr:hypothetical protein [Parasporobacterium sp.]
MSDYKSYLHSEYYFDPMTKLAMGLGVFVLGGVLGFIYSSIFYWANSGFLTFYWRTGTFGPWSDAYSIIALLLFLFLRRLRKYPVAAILIGTVICTVVQAMLGLGLYYFGNGMRAWNYNLEILNFGNFGGFICLRSVIEFMIFTILIMYVIAPLVYHMACAMSKGAFVTLWLIIGSVCAADIIYNNVLCVLIPSLKNASDVYKAAGMRFMTF